MCIYENLHWTLSWIVLVIAWLKLLLLALHVKFFKWYFLVGVNVFDKKVDPQITIIVLLYFQTMVSVGIPLLTEQFIVIEYSATACTMPYSVSFWTAMFVGISELNTKIILLYLLCQMHILWQFSFFPFFKTTYMWYATAQSVFFIICILYVSELVNHKFTKHSIWVIDCSNNVTTQHEMLIQYHNVINKKIHANVHCVAN